MAGIVVSPDFLMDFESRMRVITSQAYDALNRESWWQKLTRTHQSKNRRELMTWLLDTAVIEYEEEGNIQFEELSHQMAQYEVEFASRGFKVKKSQFEDLDGNGIRLAADWARQIGAYAAYFPQKQAARALLEGTSRNGYDGVPFFSASHPVDPFNSAAGTYSNLITTGIHLDDRNPMPLAFQSLNTIKKAIASVPMPNGEDPRNLRPRFFLAPPAMTQRLNLLLSAKFIGLGSGGAGATDVQGVVASMGFAGGVVEAPELGAAYGGSDTDCYLVCDEVGSPDLDALVWIEREPFEVRYYSGQDGGGISVDLNRIRELEWHVQGRNVLGYGHPFKVFKLVGQEPPEEDNQ